MSGRRRVAVLISGRGSNMAALVQGARKPDYPAEIVAVLSDKAEAQGLATARSDGIGAIAVPRSDYPDKQSHESAVLEALEKARPDVICLAGYMRLLSPAFIARYRGRIINIHPSLLPLFPGLDTHRRALDAGVRIHGCTVHFVTDGMDEGPIVAQAAVPVVPGDTADTLQERVLAAEHRLYPAALAMVAAGAARMNDEGRTVFAGDAASGARAASGALFSTGP